MSYTNSTPNYDLPQWIGTDKPTFLGDFNSAFSAIDTQMKANADASTAATATANSAAATATSANTNAITALNTANSAASEAASATSAAASATSTANTASTNAEAALRASAANTIENLAPAYDPTLTYSVGDLVTYIDDQNSGKLYKCIVAVTSPMEFNINYWDDVTTSEAYANKTLLVATVVGDGVKTLGEVLAELYSSAGIESGLEYLLVIDDVIIHSTFNNYNYVNFIQLTANNSSAVLTTWQLSDTANGCVVIRWELNTSGNSVTTKTNDLSTNGTEYKLYKLMTIA